MSLTISQVLGGGRVLSAALKQNPALIKSITQGFKAASMVVGGEDLNNAIGDALDLILELNLTAPLAMAWDNAQVFDKFANPKKHHPEQVHKVPLLAHKISTSYEPEITLHFAGAELPGLNIKPTVKIELAIEGMIVVVRKVRLSEIQAGEIELKLEVLFGQHQLYEKKVPVYKIDKKIPLGENGQGIPIKAPEPEKAAPKPAEPPRPADAPAAAEGARAPEAAPPAPPAQPG